MSMTSYAVESEYRRKCESEKSGQSVNGRIAPELRKSKVVGEVIDAQRTPFNGEGGGADYAVQI